MRPLLLIVLLGYVGLVLGQSVCDGGPGYYLNDMSNRLSKMPVATDKDLKERNKVLAVLSAWQDVNSRVGRSAGKVEPIIACSKPGIAAYTIGAQRSQPIRVTVDLLDMLGDNRPLIAVLLGHEYAHLTLGHGSHRQEALQILSGEAARTYQRIRSQDRMWGFDEQNRSLAYSVATEQLKIRYFAYTRSQELKADEFGIALTRKAGYPPSAFDSLASKLTSEVGQEFTELMSTHPGWLDRRVAAVPVIQDEEFSTEVQEAFDKKNKRLQKSLVAQWIQLLPGSGKAWYYKSILLGNKEKRVEALELAIASRSPELKIEQNVLDNAYLRLCTGLFGLGYKSESAQCAQTFLYNNDTLKAKFLSRTFGESLQVGGGFPTIQLASVHDSQGYNLITDDFTAATNLLGGVDPTPILPWRPGRFQSCADFARCHHVVRYDHDYDLSVRPPDADPFVEVRNKCAPPLCRREGFN